MQNSNQTTQGRDPELWEIAKRRAGFKSHLATYLIMVPFFWLIWWFSGAYAGGAGLPWAIWPTFGWGVGLFFHYMGAYVFHRDNQVQREYDKLKRG
jgi:hypothetical protein